MLLNKLNFDLKKIVSKSESKPAICGVLVTPDKTVATDSFRLAEITTVKNIPIEDFPTIPDKKIVKKPKSFILPIEAVNQLHKNLTIVGKSKSSRNLPILKYGVVTKQDDTQVEISATDLEQVYPLFARVVEGDYPEYEKIIPKGKPVSKVNVNAKYLKELLEIVEKFGRNDHKVTINFFGEDKPITLNAENSEQKFLGLLMPIRDK